MLAELIDVPRIESLPRDEVLKPDHVQNLLAARHDQITLVLGVVADLFQLDLVQLGKEHIHFEGETVEDSLRLNQELALSIQSVIDRLGVAVACGKDDCEVPAVVRCTSAKTTKGGIFQFSHYIDGRTTNHKGPKHLPSFKLTEKKKK